MDKRIVVTALISSIGGFLVGGGVTYLTVKKTFEARAQRDIDDVKQTYHDRFDGLRVVRTPEPAENDFENPKLNPSNISAEDLQQAKEFVEKLGYQEARKFVGQPEEVGSVNIYNRQEIPKGEEVISPLLVGYDAAALKKAHKPYLISREDFDSQETEWDKISIDYYEDDDVLADEKGIPIPDIEYLVGEKHLDFFGLKSGDKNIVFVRNPQISTDFEVTRNSGSYTEIVLNEPRGADKLGTRRMRDGDDG